MAGFLVRISQNKFEGSLRLTTGHALPTEAVLKLQQAAIDGHGFGGINGSFDSSIHSR